MNTVPAPLSTPVTVLSNLPSGSFEGMRVSAMLPRTYWQSARASTAVPSTATQHQPQFVFVFMILLLLQWPVCTPGCGIRRASAPSLLQAETDGGTGHEVIVSFPHPWEERSPRARAADEVTNLLRAWSNGDQAALERLSERVYGEIASAWRAAT